MNYFCGSINPKGKWNIFDFSIGETDSFYAHSGMSSGAYAILKCISDLYQEEENGKIRNRINAECIYHSGLTPFINRKELEYYMHLPIRIPIQIKNNLE